MGNCELCGKDSSNLKKVLIVGSEMEVCPGCSNKGKPIHEKKEISKTFYKKRKDETIEEIVPNSLKIINSQMLKKDLDVHKLARAINMKESILSKILLGKLNLDINTARKLEKFLKIKLIEVTSINSENPQNFENLIEDKEDENSSLSLGDLLLKELEKKKKNGN